MPAAVAVVTDSSSEIDPVWARVLGVAVVPLFITFGELRRLDGVELSRTEFYRKLSSTTLLPVISQPTASAFSDVFEPLINAGRAIICITSSAKLSGTMNAAWAAAEAFPHAHIEVIDSATTSAGLMLQVVRAAALASGGAGPEAIAAALLRDRARQRGYAAGNVRLGKGQALLRGLFDSVPVLAIRDGEIGLAARARTFARAQDAMIEAVARDASGDAQARIAVAHAGVPDAGQAAARRLAAKLQRPEGDVSIVEAGPAFAVQAGAGAVGIFCVGH